jgi:ABC-type branched-subunit amino acid transport system substrate-binding protein
MITRRFLLQSAAAAAAYSAQGFRSARAENAPGVTDTEIKIGQTMPYSGPVSAYGVIGRTELAYFKMINEQGGVNGRKLNLISLDDGFSPPKTVEQTRRLVEQEQVAFIFGTVGTAPNSAIYTYLNEHKIPQLFIGSGASKFADPQHFPWTMTYDPIRRSEGRLFAKYIVRTMPGAKIGVLYQNDDLGRDYLVGVREGLGADHATMLAKEASYEVSDPTVDSQIITLQGAGVDSLIIAATPKAAAQAIRKVYDLGWTPERYLATISSSINSVLKPAGIEKSKGMITNLWIKDPSDPRWKDDPDYKEWAAFVTKYMTPGDLTEGAVAYGYGVATIMTYVLKRCGDDLSRENIMRQATNIKDYAGPFALPGAKINTSPDDYRVNRQFRLARFDGANWEWFGELLTD